jgi:transcriptional regulator with XRE-family HTH domain
MFFVVRKFGELLEGVLPRFPTKQAFAKEIGISPSRFSRLLAGRERPGDSLNVLHCLKLAKATGLPPSDVLRTAGKDKIKIADLIESLYGRDRTKLLTTFEAAVLERLAGLTDADAEMVLQIVDRFRQAETEPPRRRHSPVARRRAPL